MNIKQQKILNKAMVEDVCKEKYKQTKGYIFKFKDKS